MSNASAAIASDQVLLCFVLAGSSLVLGYLVGLNSRRPARRHFTFKHGIITHKSDTTDDDVREREISSMSEDRNLDHDALAVDLSDECKFALVVRTDLGMTSGKIAAQCSHATLACYKSLQVSNPALLRQWERTGQTKIALRCKDEDELLSLQAQAQSLNLCARSIQDAGRTQIAAGSRTVLGIAGPARLINQVTGKLRLL